jgi:hypothetical protein
MRASRYISIVLAGALLVLSVPALAHHSIPAFWYPDKTIQITGTVKEVKIINPHSIFIIEVTEANGQKTEWTGVTASGAAMFRAGWTSETLKIGSKVTVEGNPPRNETAKGILITSFTLPDGRKITPAKID